MRHKPDTTVFDWMRYALVLFITIGSLSQAPHPWAWHCQQSAMWTLDNGYICNDQGFWVRAAGKCFNAAKEFIPANYPHVTPNACFN